MFRTEKDLLNGLLDTIDKTKYAAKFATNNIKETVEKTKPLTKEEESEMEKYRDNDGFINLKSILNPKDIARIFDIVDRKNYIEELKNKKTLKNESILDTITEIINELPQKGTKIVATVSPDGKLTIKSNDFICNDEESNEKKEIVNETVDETVAKPIEDEENNLEVIGEKTIKDYDNEEIMVMLDDVSGDYHPLYYNAVRHICETQYFPKNGVYTFNEISPKECDVAILLPNVWGKVTSKFIDIYDTYLKDGGKLFIINPETFECEEIKDSERLWDFEMSIIQEEMNR